MFCLSLARAGADPVSNAGQFFPTASTVDLKGNALCHGRSAEVLVHVQLQTDHQMASPNGSVEGGGSAVASIRIDMDEFGNQPAYQPWQGTAVNGAIQEMAIGEPQDRFFYLKLERLEGNQYVGRGKVLMTDREGNVNEYDLSVSTSEGSGANS